MQTRNWNSLLYFNITIKKIHTFEPPSSSLLNGVQTHGVQQAVGEVVETIQRHHGPERGVGDEEQFATGCNDFIKRQKHMQDQRQP